MTLHEKDGKVFVRCNSHRARKRLFRLLPDWEPEGFYSWHRGPHKGIYQIPSEMTEQVLKIKGVTRLRGPFDDLHLCWSM